MEFTPTFPQELGHEHLTTSARAALWMGMGLGKTSTTCWSVDTLFNNWATRGVLVVAPLRVCVLTWPNEIAKWDKFSWMRIANLRTSAGWEAMINGTAHIYLINWDQLQLLCDGYLHKRRPDDIAFDTVVLDESTCVKNHESARFRHLKGQLHKFKRVWELTGTPAPNSLLELWSQIYLLDEGKRLGRTFESYRDTHFDAKDKFGYAYKLREGHADLIHAQVADIALVLRSKDYLKIPPPEVEDIEIKFPSAARKMYETLAEELMVITARSEEIVALNAGVLVNKLLQVTGGAVYLQQEWDEDLKPLPKDIAIIHQEKLEELKRLSKRVGDRPMIIVCHYQHEQARIHEALPGSIRFDSYKSDASLQAFETQWSAGRIHRLIVDPRSMSHGLNLQFGGSDIAWYSVSHSRERYDQTNGRLARTGQTNVTRIYRLTIPGTIDDAVIEVLSERDRSQNALLEAVMNFRKLRLLAA